MNNKYPKSVNEAMKMLKRENEAIKKHNEKVYKNKVKVVKKMYEKMAVENAKNKARNYNKTVKK